MAIAQRILGGSYAHGAVTAEEVNCIVEALDQAGPSRPTSGVLAMTEIPAVTKMRELTDAELDMVSGGGPILTEFTVGTPNGLFSHNAANQATNGLAMAGPSGGDHGVIIPG